MGYENKIFWARFAGQTAGLIVGLILIRLMFVLLHSYWPWSAIKLN